MKKIRIIVTSIAFVAVLSMSITIGVFAARQSTFGISSSISFVSPDLDIIIDCYIGADTSGEPDHTYSKDKREPWIIDQAKFSFKTTSGSADVASEVLTLVVTNNTVLPVYSYFTKAGEADIIYSDLLDGDAKEGDDENATVINEDIIAVSLDGQKKISAKSAEATEGEKSTSTISFKLNKNLKVSDSATFNYTMVISKESANLFNVISEEDFTNTPTVSVEDKTITNIANGTNGIFSYYTRRFIAGKYVASGETTGSGIRFLAKAYDENNTELTGETITIEGGTYNEQYGGWYFPKQAETTINIPEQVAYWNFGFVFMDEAGESVTYSNISVVQK